jgi:hypothetical protein
MFAIDNFRDSRYYQEVSAEAILKDRQKMLAHFLNDRFEPPTTEVEIQQLQQMIETLPHLERERFADVVFALAKETPQFALRQILQGRFDQIPKTVDLKIEQTHRKALERWIWQALIVESMAAFSDLFVGQTDVQP